MILLKKINWGEEQSTLKRMYIPFTELHVHHFFIAMNSHFQQSGIYFHFLIFRNILIGILLLSDARFKPNCHFTYRINNVRK